MLRRISKLRNRQIATIRLIPMGPAHNVGLGTAATTTALAAAAMTNVLVTIIATPADISHAVVPILSLAGLAPTQLVEEKQ